MQIDLRQVAPKGSLKTSREGDAFQGWCDGLGVSAVGACTVELEYERRGTHVRVCGQLRAEVSGPCAHCGQELVVSVGVDAAATFVPVSAQDDPVDDLKDEDGLQGIELSAEVMEQETYSGEVIALEDWLRDEWRLGVPLALRCPDEVCREAADSSPEPVVDPRWAALAALRDNLPGAE